MEDLTFSIIYFLSCIILGLFIFWISNIVINKSSKYIFMITSKATILISILLCVLFVFNIISIETIWILLLCILYPFNCVLYIIIICLGLFLKNHLGSILKIVGLTLLINTTTTVLYCYIISEKQIYRNSTLSINFNIRTPDAVYETILLHDCIV